MYLLRKESCFNGSHVSIIGNTRACLWGKKTRSPLYFWSKFQISIFCGVNFTVLYFTLLNIGTIASKTHSNKATDALQINVTRCTIWYHSQFKKGKKHPWRSVTFSKKPSTLLKVTLLHGCFSRFLNSINGTKLRKTCFNKILFPTLTNELYTLYLHQLFQSSLPFMFPMPIFESARNTKKLVLNCYSITGYVYWNHFKL